MKKMLVTTIAAAMALSASAAVAQDGAYVTRDASGNLMVMSGTEGVPVLRGENYAAPSDCPAGSYYEGGQNQLVACEGGATFGMMAPPAGTMMSDGQPYPEGAMMLESRENNSGATN